MTRAGGLKSLGKAEKNIRKAQLRGGGGAGPSNATQGGNPEGEQSQSRKKKRIAEQNGGSDVCARGKVSLRQGSQKKVLKEKSKRGEVGIARGV